MSEKSEGTISKQLTLFAEDSLARTSVRPDKKRESRGNGRGFGLNSTVSFATYDLDSYLWKTSQLCLVGGLMLYSETWPRAGMMRNGTVYRQHPLAPLTDVIGFSLWPTPQAFDSHNSGMKQTDEAWHRRLSRGGCSNLAEMVETPRWYTGRIPEGQWTWGTGQLNPLFSEYLMGFPIGWTDLEHSETP